MLNPHCLLCLVHPVFYWYYYVAMYSPMYFQESMREKLMNVERESKGSKTWSGFYTFTFVHSFHILTFTFTLSRDYIHLVYHCHPNLHNAKQAAKGRGGNQSSRRRAPENWSWYGLPSGEFPFWKYGLHITKPISPFQSNSNPISKQ